ncbi:hypothetical protein Tco_1391467 [Tanacetum coccineum]
MANFPRLDELTVVANSRGLFNGMFMYFDQENGKDLDFSNGLHNLWDELLERTNERQLFITKLEDLCPSDITYQILKFLNEVQNHDLIYVVCRVSQAFVPKRSAWDVGAKEDDSESAHASA